MLWALLGFLTWYGVPRTTGSHPARVLGRISLGAGPLVLLPPPPTVPTRLTVQTAELSAGGRPVA